MKNPSGQDRTAAERNYVAKFALAKDLSNKIGRNCFHGLSRHKKIKKHTKMVDSFWGLCYIKECYIMARICLFV